MTSTEDSKAVKASPEKAKPKTEVKLAAAGSKKNRPRRKTLKPGSIRYGRSKRAIIKKVLRPHIIKKEKVVSKAPVKVIKKSKAAKRKADKGKEGTTEEKKVERKTPKTRQLLVKKAPSYYPTEVKKGRTHDKKKQAKQYLKKSLTPGVVCIILAGPHKGKRAVFLKQLASGLCLITGPFILNRCPLRRINQIYLIGTSTKIDLGADFKVPEHVDDKYFRRVKLNKKKPKKEGEDIFNEKPKKYVVSAVKKADQKIVDVDIIKAMRKRKDRKSIGAYMSTKFRLTNQQFPHLLKF